MGQPRAKPKLIQPAEPVSRKPAKFTYALKAHTAEMRQDGWWITATPLAFAQEKPAWVGPFPTIEDACRAIARCLATELANRHAAIAARPGIQPGHPLDGLIGAK